MGRGDAAGPGECHAEDPAPRHRHDQHRQPPQLRRQSRLFCLLARALQGSRRVAGGAPGQAGRHRRAGARPSARHVPRPARSRPGAAAPQRRVSRRDRPRHHRRLPVLGAGAQDHDDQRHPRHREHRRRARQDHRQALHLLRLPVALAGRRRLCAARGGGHRPQADLPLRDRTVTMISEPLRNPLSLFDVKDKVAIVTGASGTFGRATALALSALGGKVLLASGSKAELDQVADEVREVGGDPATIVRRPETLEDGQAMLDAALKRFGRVDQLVVASGVNKPGFIHEQTLDEWQSVMDANVRGIWLMAKAVGTWWIANKVRGKVVVMSSVRGRHGNYSGYTGYCTSKGATDSLTRVLATEWAQHGITVNAIAPTVCRSKLTEWMYGDNELGQQTRARSLSRIPLGRLGEVEDLVGMTIYLLSPASDFCTGQIMYVDGGYTAG